VEDIQVSTHFMRTVLFLNIIHFFINFGFGQNSINVEELKYSQKADSFSVFYNNCELSDDKIQIRKAGQKIVFYYYFKNKESEIVTDSHYSEEIQFEITPVSGQDLYKTSNPEEFNTIYNWDCFCECPDSNQAKNNIGEITAIKINDTIWIINLEIENKPYKKEKIINTVFYIYKPFYEVINGDTINRFDKIGRKQGKWKIEKDTYLKEGDFLDNYFTGTECFYVIRNGKKVLGMIIEYEKNKIIRTINFD